MRLKLIFPFLLLSGCVSNTFSESRLAFNGLGTSKKEAVALECVSNGLDGVMKEAEWIRENYPGYEKVAQIIDDGNGRIYDKIIIRRGKKQFELYFDITEWFGRFEKIELSEKCNEKSS